MAGPIWKLDGESCACILPAVHVFAENAAERWHRCTCRTEWVDDQQIDEARRRQGGDGMTHDPYAWVRDRVWVEIPSQAGGPPAAGEVIGYQVNPTITVRTEDGRQEAYPAASAHVAERPVHALTLHLEPDDGRRWRGDNVAGPWELMNRRADGGDDGPNFSTVDYLRTLGTVVVE